MIWTKKEYNDLVAERKTMASAPNNSLHPLKLGAVVARARWGLQSRARVLHTLPWALIPIRAEFPIFIRAVLPMLTGQLAGNAPRGCDRHVGRAGAGPRTQQIA